VAGDATATVQGGGLSRAGREIRVVAPCRGPGCGRGRLPPAAAGLPGSPRPRAGAEAAF